MLVQGPEAETGVHARDVCFAHCPDSAGTPGAREVQAALEQSGMQSGMRLVRCRWFESSSQPSVDL